MSEIQAVIFSRGDWTTTRARAWLRKYNIPRMSRVHVTDNFYRYRINPPGKYKRLRYKSLKGSIKLVIGFNN